MWERYEGLLVDVLTPLYSYIKCGFWKIKLDGGGGIMLLPGIWRQKKCVVKFGSVPKSGKRALVFRFPLLSFLVGQIRKMGSGRRRRL